MNFSTVDNALWAASLIGHVALVLILVLRRKLRQFPVFSTFIAFSALVTILLFFVYRFGTNHQYFLAYWITGGANYLFQVGLIVEIARNVLRPTGRWVLEARKSFLIWAAVGLGIAAIMAYELGPSQSKGIELWDTRITVFTALMTCGLFLAMMTAANRLGLRWRSQVYAVGQGLFIWSLISLFGDVAHTALGWNREFVVLDYVQMFAYLAVVVFWGITFWFPEKERAELSPEIRAYLVAAAARLEYDRSADYPRP
jgi:peptidoglycan/LPS O-acetylase OafA/YrhL